MNKIRIAAILIAVGMLSGCVTAKSYVDPSFSKAGYGDLYPVGRKYDANVTVEFQRNGELLEKVNSEVENHVLRSLRSTGVINPVTGGSGMSLHVVVNNIADMGNAAAKGIGTGLTLGLAGSVVTDHYEISIEFSDGRGGVIRNDYRHALHTTVGNKKAPISGVAATTPADAFGTVVEQTIVNFVKDMQDIGLLTNLESSEPADRLFVAFWRGQSHYRLAPD